MEMQFVLRIETPSELAVVQKYLKLIEEEWSKLK